MSTTKTKVQRLILYEDPATLQSLAAVTVAAQLWRREIVKSDVHVRPMNTALPLAKSIPGVSTKFEKLIEKCVEPVRKSLLGWLDTQYYRIFFLYEKQHDVLKKYFDCITWRADCTIDFERTAEKLIACKKLSVVCKYKTACTYCLEDDVRRLWKELPTSRKEFKAICISNFLAHYWDCRMKIEQASSIVGGGSIDGKLFDKLKPENWLAWKYCWTKLSADHQIDKAVAMIDNKEGLERYVTNLLPLMTKLQLVKVMKKCTKDVIAVLASSPENVKHALETWHFVRNFVSAESFVKMFVDVLSSNLDVNQQQYSSVVQNHNQHNTLKLFDTTYMMNVNVSSLLYEIWKDSPDHLRVHLIDQHVAKVLSKLSKVDHCFTLKTQCRDVRLMLEILKRSDYLVNNTFWRKHWTDLIKGVRSSQLGEIMKLCFRNDKEIGKFKKTHMSVYSKIDTYCIELICQGCFDELNDFLSFCTSDPNVIVGLKRNVLLNPVQTLSFCVFNSDDPIKMQALDDFIADIYPDPGRRRNLKCQMVTSITNFKFLQSCISDGFLIPVKNFVALFLTREAELKNVKKSFKQQCVDILSKGEFHSFNGDHWNEFLSWCVNDDQQELDQIKKSVSVGDIYRIVFAKCVRDIQSRFAKSILHDKIVDALFDDYKGKRAESIEMQVQSKSLDKRAESIEKQVQSKSLDEDIGDSNASSEDPLKELVWDKNDFVGDYLDAFDKLSHFLLWYFTSKAKVDEFKMAVVKKKGFVGKVAVVKDIRVGLVILNWFFNSDVERLKSYLGSF